MKKTWFKSVFFFQSFCIVYNSIKYLFLLQKQEILDKNSNISFFFSFLVLYFFQVIMYLLIKLLHHPKTFYPFIFIENYNEQHNYSYSKRSRILETDRQFQRHHPVPPIQDIFHLQD